MRRRRPSQAGGQWVSPVEVENTLVAHEAVLEVAVVGVEDDAGLTKPVAYVVVRRGVAASDELAKAPQDFVKERIALFKYPREVHFIDELPKTATGKIQRYKLRAVSAEPSSSGDPTFAKQVVPRQR